MKAQFLFLMHCALSLEATAQAVPTFELSKQRALQFVRKTHSQICVAKGSKYIAPMYFQQELLAHNKKYTVAWVESVDKRNATVRKKSAFPLLLKAGANMIYTF